MANNQSYELNLKVKGMTCSGCAASIKTFVEEQGIDKVLVSFEDGEVWIKDSQPLNQGKIESWIEQLGFRVVEDTHEAKWYERVEVLFYTCLIFTLPLFLSMFLPKSWIIHNGWLQLALCLPVFVIGLFYFGKSAFYSLKNAKPNMDVLIIMGATAAFFYSLYGTVANLGHKFMFYETSATIITLVLLGNLIQKRTVKQTTSAIKNLASLQKVKANKIDVVFDKEIISQIDSDKIKLDDLLLVNTGDRIPTDGKIYWGHAAINESVITGESLPVEKDINDDVIGGSLLENGSIKIKATNVGHSTVLSQIINLVKNAQAEKPQIQQLGDKVSNYFVPIVVGLSILTFLISFFLVDIPFKQSLLQSIAVLVISCPCAMGLATPTAVAAGLGRAAKNGILIKGARTLEHIANANQVVFDKTGTLTTGKFKVKNLSLLNGLPQQQVEDIIYNLEKHSNHPIAKSLIEAYPKSNELEFEEIVEKKGFGIEGKNKDGSWYKLWSAARQPCSVNEEHDIHLYKNNDLIATLQIEDELKEGVGELISYLKSQGKTTILLSGDKEDKCKSLAEKVGFDQYHSQMLPEEKLAVIKELNANGHTIMVGDGVNDAPALTSATAGISMSDSTSIAVDAADVILLGNNMAQLIKVFQLGNHTLLTIKQNLFWAFFYNVVAIPIAAVGLLSPMVAALAMASSDVVVIGNSIRLKFKQIFRA